MIIYDSHINLQREQNIIFIKILKETQKINYAINTCGVLYYMLWISDTKGCMYMSYIRLPYFCLYIICVKILFMFIFMQGIRAIYMHYQSDMYIIIIKSQNKHVNINLHIYKLCNNNVYLDILILYFSLMWVI